MACRKRGRLGMDPVGIEIATSVTHALAIDEKNGNTLGNTLYPK